MPVLGVVVVTDGAGAPATLEASLRSLSPGLTLGSWQGGRLPLVLETAEAGQEEALLGAIESIAGVWAAQVVFVDFSDVEGVEASFFGRRRRGGMAGVDGAPAGESAVDHGGES